LLDDDDDELFEPHGFESLGLVFWFDEVSGGGGSCFGLFALESGVTGVISVPISCANTDDATTSINATLSRFTALPPALERTARWVIPAARPRGASRRR
jgi:hypothetical protein